MTFKEFFAKCTRYALKPIDWVVRIRFYGKMQKLDRTANSLKKILTKIQEKKSILKNPDTNEIKKIIDIFDNTLIWCDELDKNMKMKYSKIFYRFCIEFFTLLILATKFILPLLPLIGSILFTTAIVLSLTFFAYKYHVVSKNLKNNDIKEIFAELENFDCNILECIDLMAKPLDLNHMEIIEKKIETKDLSELNHKRELEFFSDKIDLSGLEDKREFQSSRLDLDKYSYVIEKKHNSYDSSASSNSQPVIYYKNQELIRLEFERRKKQELIRLEFEKRKKKDIKNKL